MLSTVDTVFKKKCLCKGCLYLKRRKSVFEFKTSKSSNLPSYVMPFKISGEAYWHSYCGGKSSSSSGSSGGSRLMWGESKFESLWHASIRTSQKIWRVWESCVKAAPPHPPHPINRQQCRELSLCLTTVVKAILITRPSFLPTGQFGHPLTP